MRVCTMNSKAPRKAVQQLFSRLQCIYISLTSCRCFLTERPLHEIASQLTAERDSEEQSSSDWH